MSVLSPTLPERTRHVIAHGASEGRAALRKAGPDKDTVIAFNPAPHPLAQNALVIAEELAAVHTAEQYLADFSDWWPYLPAKLQPSVIREALWCLTICWLANPLQTEIRLSAVAQAASLPRSELHEQVKRRAETCRNYRRIWKRNRKAVEQEALGWML